MANNRKCKIIFAISMTALAVGLGLLTFAILLILKVVSFPIEWLSYVCIGVAVVLVIIGIIMFFISIYLNLSYRKTCAHPGAFSNFLYGWSYVLLKPLQIILSFFHVDNGELKNAVVKSDDGKEYILTQKYSGGSAYRDQYGDDWETGDGGTTFRRVTKDINVVDENGNAKTLTPTYDDMVTKNYQDQDGGEWKSEDGGGTFKQVVTKAEVTDELGNKYQLRAVQAGLNNFIDQNGDSWITYDGGKTFERLN